MFVGVYLAHPQTWHKEDGVTTKGKKLTPNLMVEDVKKDTARS